MHQAILLLKQIPKGRVVTYKEMARVCNTSPRAIGRIMAGNQDPVNFPCYKVVSLSGELCGYSAKGGLLKKAELLKKEGIVLYDGKVPENYFYHFKKSNTIKSPAKYLQSVDPILGDIMSQIQLPVLQPNHEYFRALVESIISQQLSAKAADTIFRRFVGLFPEPFPEPRDVIAVPEKTIRSIGVSLQKISYIKNLARAVDTGKINFPRINELSDQEVIATLTRIKGIGPWTGEMFLIFSLARPDVFSFGDLGLKNAIRQLYRLRGDPTKKRLEQITRRWRPYRSLACRYLWASLDNR